MYIPEPIFIVFSGLACYGLICFLLELRAWCQQKRNELIPLRLALLFRDNADSVEWLLRRLNHTLSSADYLPLAEIKLIDTGSLDDTPAILRRMTRENYLYRAITIYQDPSREMLKNTVVIDCRDQSWLECFDQIRRIITQHKRQAGDRERWAVDGER
jgi:hypothetical protein